MREIYCFDINPIPAARPRVSRWSTYYPKKYTQFKKEMLALTSELDVTPIENLVRVELVFNVKMPNSWSKKKKLEKINTYCDNNVDLDNYQKAILDSLNGVLYLDDRQVVEIWAVKQWKDVPKITVGIIDKGE
tara:strand:- start:217 stop:615 length:399 start_codon:yes stop_codon:yes gene_type:complete